MPARGCIQHLCHLPLARSACVALLSGLQRAGYAAAAALPAAAVREQRMQSFNSTAACVSQAAWQQQHPHPHPRPQLAPKMPWPPLSAEPAVSSWQQQLLPRFRGLLVDAAGTLIIPSEPAALVYLRFAQKYGCVLSEQEILQRFRQAYNTPWGQSTIRYVGDGRPFWRHIVRESTGCRSEAMFEEVYDYYARGDSYFVTPGAVESLERIRAAGVRTAVVSNFDTRLWRILDELGIRHLFDAVIVSAEVQAEKPNPVIFEAACQALNLPPESCVHVGDDRRNDLYGARDSGCFAWLWGQDVLSFAEVERRLASGNYLDSLSEV